MLAPLLLALLSATIVGFVPGLGIVRYAYSHHGTTAEADAWLVAYHAR